ncbi:MAG: Shedu anti-phage system protein SduA domain-containing protein [Paraglaciecola sp.]|uniref:Shedu anti-phage system protein SduA domain-containing protein n=1 Tax=Paraglaciecola sp. TaxID=1920173 RepID=UPI0032971B7E
MNQISISELVRYRAIYKLKPSDFYPEDEHDHNHDRLIEYSKKRNFSDSLTQRCLEAFRKSVKNGDGCLWSDTLLWEMLESKKSNVHSALQSTIGKKGDLLHSLTLKDTLATQNFTYRPSFQTDFDNSIAKLNRNYPNKQLEEDDILAIEISEASEFILDNDSDLIAYTNYLLEPLLDYISIDRLEQNRNLWEFKDKFIDAFVLSLTAMQNPLDAFVSQSLPDNMPSEKKYLIFLHYLRDAVYVSPKSVPDILLVKMSKMWNDETYDETEKIFLERWDQPSEADHARDNCLFAASHLINHNIPLNWLLKKLEIYKMKPADFDRITWDNDEILLLRLEGREIRVSPTEFQGIQKFRGDTIQGNSGIGIITPNPIWNQSVIDRFEFIINSPNIKESDLQLFFEMYPDFILSDLHVSAKPQVILFNEFEKRSLKPDFVLQRADSSFIDIVEIKKPEVKLATGTEHRPSETRALAKSISQLKEYGDWFNDSRNRDAFRKKYGLDGFKPNLTLIIGRSSGFKNEMLRQKILQSSGVNIFTYDDLLKMSKVRANKIYK